MEYYLVSHSNFDTYIHQNQITTPEQKKDHTDYLASTSATKILALSIQSNAPKPNVFFLFTIGLGSRGILSSTTSRRQEISVRTEMEKQWVQRITAQRRRGQRGEQLPSEQYVAFGFCFFSPLQRVITATILWGEHSIGWMDLGQSNRSKKLWRWTSA